MAPGERRKFLTGMATLGAHAFLSRHAAEAQMSTAKPHRIDVHHHHTPPPYLAAITAQNIPGPVRDWTPEKSIADMDKAGVATASLLSEHGAFLQEHANDASLRLAVRPNANPPCRSPWRNRRLETGAPATHPRATAALPPASFKPDD